jgi:hypothetical protein
MSGQRIAVLGGLTGVLITIGLVIGPVALDGQPKPVWARFAPLPYGFNVGDVFPTRALPSAVDGKPTSLAAFRGKKVIVNVFASW